MSVRLVARALGASMHAGPQLIKTARSCCRGMVAMVPSVREGRGLAALDESTNRMLQYRGASRRSSAVLSSGRSGASSGAARTASGVQLQTSALRHSGRQQSGKY